MLRPVAREARNTIHHLIMRSDAGHRLLAHQQAFRRLPRLWAPRTFNEKLLYKQMFDRNPLIVQTTDKYAVRDYVAQKIGAEYLIPLLAVHYSAETITLDGFPDEFVMKATHGSAWVKIVRKHAPRDENELRALAAAWLSTNFYQFNREWQYRSIPPRIVFEKLLTQRDGSIPVDYKFFCFRGSPLICEVDVSRFTDHRRNLYKLPLWTRINGELGFPNAEEEIEPPADLSSMMMLARRLSADFDFVRVDLYDVDDGVYFGELTHSPGACTERFSPPSLDYKVGALWK